MSVRLDARDFERTVRILGGMPDFRTVRSRVDFVTDVFAGTPRRDDVIASLDIDGAPRGVAVRVVDRLQAFGQDEPGRETLGVLVNKMIAYLGGGDDAEYLRELLARYPFTVKPSADRGPSGDWRGRENDDQVAEKIIGENTLRDIALLELALEAARAVVRVVTPRWVGTGFLTTGGLLVTNHHVIGDSGTAEASTYDFDYQLDGQGLERPVQTRRCKPGGLFHTSARLDVTMIELPDIPDGVRAVPLVAERVFADQRVNIIQHPGGHYKKISMQNNFVVYADRSVIQYTTSTQPGSSGSPVFNNEFEVVGIHHSGGMLREPNSEKRYLRNAGTTAIAVLEDIRMHSPELAERLLG
ncbi:trypsin-like peptidase domain-containing protein [Streptomyces blattellae]|uniref:trypsin-like peptidase domain-containing protein n=1 Tax=Streptomyces blattellae TaxID=2569855 RepID=UPI0018AC8EA4|nr:trypsin-like peptidase domain-containing protein [Streptomyces blattellae]